MTAFKLMVLKKIVGRRFAAIPPMPKRERDALRATRTMGSTEKQAPGGCE